MKKKLKPIHFDEAWKFIFSLNLKEALAYFHPKLAMQIDWQKNIEYIEQELGNFTLHSNQSFKRVDKLIKVNLLNKKNAIIYLHTEIQAFKPNEIAARMFQYYMYLSIQYPTFEIHSLLVYIGSEVPSKEINKHIINNSSNFIHFECTYYSLGEHSDKALIEENSLISICLLCTKWIHLHKSTEESRYKMLKKCIIKLNQTNISVESFRLFIKFAKELVPLKGRFKIEINKFIHKKTNIMVAQIRDTNHANEIKESLSKILRTGKTEKDFFKEGKLEGKQEIILTLLKKGYNANQIADLLNLNQPFVEKFIQKK